MSALVRRCDMFHQCRKCKQETALCFHDPNDDHEDIKYVCQSCWHEWWIDGIDS